MTYSLGILAEEMGAAIEKINVWLSKSEVITCYEVTAIQLPQVIKHVYHTAGFESVVFNTRVDDMRSDSNPGVHSGYHIYLGCPAVLGASGTTFLNKIPGIPQFSGTEGKRAMSSLNSGCMLSLIPGKKLMISGQELLSINHVWRMWLMQFAVYCLVLL